MSAVTDISKYQPHVTIKGLRAVHVLPLSVLQDVVERRKCISQIDDWQDFLPEILNDFLNELGDL